jgi:hypothetical protein
MQRVLFAVLAATALASCGTQTRRSPKPTSDSVKPEQKPGNDVPPVTTQPQQPQPPAPPPAAPPAAHHDFATLTEWCNAAELSVDERSTIDALRVATNTAGQPCDALAAAAGKATELDLSGKGLKTLAPLASLTQLKTLKVFDDPIEDLAPVGKLVHLNGFHSNDGTYTTLAPLSALVELETLALAKAPAGDLSPLASLARLRQLWAFRMPVTDLAPLAKLAKLQNLYVWDDKIASLEPLRGLTALTDIALSGNQISDLAPLAGLTSLKAVDVSYQHGTTPITSLAALAQLPASALANLDGKKLTDGNQVAKTDEACPTDAGPTALRAVCSALIGR